MAYERELARHLDKSRKDVGNAIQKLAVAISSLNSASEAAKYRESAGSFAASITHEVLSELAKRLDEVRESMSKIYGELYRLSDIAKAEASHK